MTKRILPLIIAASLPMLANAADSNDEIVNAGESYNYISGGLQLSNTDKELQTSSTHVSAEDQFGGLYLRGSWNFTDSLFVELRTDVVTKDDLTLGHDLLGLGYFYSLNDTTSVYGLVGISTLTKEYHVRAFGHDIKLSDSDSALSGEIGLRHQITNNWTIEPAIRTAGHDESLIELRLGNTYQVSDAISIEANLQQRDHDFLKETDFQLGMRYSF
ncbi:porin family protein [Vibrio sp. Of7-15]|uniref:outer membrane beta-barrel protein n=1 Tax=Vibrio sp. Of7-15 TaxID=2724879 RepID=UPI001EF30CD0|nr:outer membrane beta-barrel protein [Vibrio sp. Of7-15]MCG7498338.1 porin family protein [Vibrio sp. Of7-15]